MSSVNNTFGTLFAIPNLERNMLDLISGWLPTYLAEVERQNDLAPGTLARPEFYGTSVVGDLHPGEKLPAIIVVSPGTEGEPAQEQGATWAAWYQATVVALVQAPAETNVRALAGMYAAAIRGVVMQHGSIGGVADGVKWMGEEYQGEPAADRNRTRGAVLIHFRVKVTNIVDGQGGPSGDPPDDPLADMPDLPIVQTVEITTASEGTE